VDHKCGDTLTPNARTIWTAKVARIIIANRFNPARYLKRGIILTYEPRSRGKFIDTTLLPPPASRVPLFRRDNIKKKKIGIYYSNFGRAFRTSISSVRITRTPTTQNALRRTFSSPGRLFGYTDSVTDAPFIATTAFFPHFWTVMCKCGENTNTHIHKHTPRRPTVRYSQKKTVFTFIAPLVSTKKRSFSASFFSVSLVSLLIRNYDDHASARVTGKRVYSVRSNYASTRRYVCNVVDAPDLSVRLVFGPILVPVVFVSTFLDGP